MGIPQILTVILYALSAGMHLERHGETRMETYNFWTALFALAIKMALLIWGGFFK